MNPKVRFLTISALLLCCALYSCRTAKEEVNLNLIISMDRTGCDNECPVYSVNVFENGLVTYIGHKHVKKKGKYKIKLAKKELHRLIRLFEKSNFFEFEESYFSEGLSNAQSTSLYFYYKSRRKKIIENHTPPKAIKNLEKELDKLIEIPNWKKVR